MKLIVLSVVTLVTFTGCSSNPKAPPVADSIRKSLDQPAFKNVSVSQDRDKGLVTLTGHVATDSEKAQAEAIARANAEGQVVSDEIAVLPPGEESTAKTINSDFDKAIEKNLDALKAAHQLDKDVKYAVKNGVVTLTGSVYSESMRTQAQKVAVTVPHVQQVVNELETHDQRATSTKP